MPVRNRLVHLFPSWWEQLRSVQLSLSTVLIKSKTEEAGFAYSHMVVLCQHLSSD